jgi:hypothetical protein
MSRNEAATKEDREVRMEIQEGRGRKSEVRRRMSEDGGRKTEIGRAEVSGGEIGSRSSYRCPIAAVA